MPLNSFLALPFVVLLPFSSPTASCSRFRDKELIDFYPELGFCFLPSCGLRKLDEEGVFASLVMASHRYTREEKGKSVAGTRQSKQWIRDPPILLPDTENEDLIEDHRLTLIGRVLHLETQAPSAVISFLPQIWGLLGRVEGKVLGRERFQFRFETEEDIEAALRRAPFHYKRWMLVLQRWEPSTSPSFPNQIPF